MTLDCRVVVALATAFVVYKSPFTTFFKTQVLLVKVVIDIILFFMLPTWFAALIANASLYITLILAQNMMVCYGNV